MIQVNYRLSSSHPYPTPVHDVLFGYDWVLQHLVPQRVISRPGRSNFHEARIGVVGEYVGGGLATMLALTECNSASPHVTATAINEPVVDWIFPETVSKARMNGDDHAEMGQFVVGVQSRKPKQSFLKHGDDGILRATDLIQARQTLFQKPAHYFDPFASPVLFFRSAGVNVPSKSFDRPLDEFEELSLLDQADFYRQQLKLSAMSNHNEAEQRIGDDTRDEVTIKPRKASRRYPRAGSGLTLPNFHIGLGHESILLDQGAELTALIRKSLVRESAAQNEEEVTSALLHAEQRVQLDLGQVSSPWDTSQPHSLHKVCRWLQEVL